MSEIPPTQVPMTPGDPATIAQLMPLVYAELRTLAATHMAREQPGHTLDATALVHEVFLKLARLVELRRFGGLPLDQCAEILGVSPRTADTWWAYARAWLLVALQDPE